MTAAVSMLKEPRGTNGTSRLQARIIEFRPLSLATRTH